MVILSKCAECKYLVPYTPGEPLTCKAYPDGIPDDWFWKGVPESQEECNNGYGFVPDDDSSWRK